MTECGQQKYVHVLGPVRDGIVTTAFQPRQHRTQRSPDVLFSGNARRSTSALHPASITSSGTVCWAATERHEAIFIGIEANRSSKHIHADGRRMSCIAVVGSALIVRLNYASHVSLGRLPRAHDFDDTPVRR